MSYELFIAHDLEEDYMLLNHNNIVDKDIHLLTGGGHWKYSLC
jgi:hypothetical protein